MEGQDIRGLIEAYSQVYETPEVLNEEVVQEFITTGMDGKPLPKPTAADKNKAAFAAKASAYKAKGGSDYAAYLAGGGDKGKKEMQAGRAGTIAPQDVERRGRTNLKAKAAKDAVTNASPTDKAKAAETIFKLKPGSLTKKESGKGSDASKDSDAGSSASKPSAPASQTVLAKKGGVEGKLDKATGKFTAGSFSDAEKSRYSSAKPAVPAKPAPGTKAAGPESIKPKTPNPLMQKTFGYQTGNAPDQIAKASAGKPTPSGSALGSAADPKVRAALNLPSKPAASLSQAPAPKPAETPKPQMSARAQALKAGGPAGSARERMLNQDLDLFDIIKGHLLDEGYADSEEGAMVIMVNMSEEWRETIIMELTGGKGHPGYKAGSKDHGDLEDHPAAKKGGVLTPRYGDHLGDLDDEDDEEEDDLEAGLKDSARKRRENVRKPLRDKVKAARKMITKEDLDQLTEISKELALKAHAERGTREFESDGDNPQDFTKSGKSKADESERRIVKKHGEGARREANRAAEKRIYGHNKYSEAQERENEKKKTKKEGYAVTIEDIVKLLDENREHDREMRKAAARERAEEKKERKEEGKKSAKAPGRLGKSAGSSYADYQEVSIKAHDKATKGKFIPGMVKNEEVELVDESALGTMAVLGGMAAGRAIHGKLEKRKAKKELEAKRKTSDYLIMKDKTKKVVARDRAAGGDTRKEDLEAWVDELIAEGYDLSGYTWEEVAEIYAQELELMDEASYSAKAARAGKDIGKPGKAFAKIAKEAGERYGSKERGEKVAGAVLAKLRKEGYQRDPEEGEEKEDKKYEKVRGEKTPMPPRGDKRREAFEKWYAKQMGR